jgi:hypothetical protein
MEGIADFRLAISDWSRAAGLMEIGRSYRTTFSIIPPWWDSWVLKQATDH